MWKLPVVVLAFLLLACGLPLPAQEAAPNAVPRTLHTEFSCRVTIATLPEGTKSVALWVPISSDSEWQKVESVHIEGLPHARITREAHYGNRMVYAVIEHPHTPLQGLVRFTVTRKEMRILGATPNHPRPLSASEQTRYLAPEQNLPVGGRFQSISDAAVVGQTMTRGKARALFEHVVGTMQYDYKQVSPEYGQGDAAFVCDYKRGDCTDLHSYLISLLRTQHIPVYHEFGFPVCGIPVPSPLPQEAKITSYHCYACYYDPETGWTPVDASDAIRWGDLNRADMKDYEFGNQLLERNAVVISRGRNLVLSPPQHGAPVNDFIHPYAEADGAPVTISTELSRRLLPLESVTTLPAH